MRVVGLISGGKDSIYSILQCIAAGHEVVAVANVEPLAKRDDMDSYMYQTVGHQTLNLLSGAMGLPIYRQRTKGIAICKEKIYVETPQDEVEDLLTLLAKVKDEMHVDGVSVGAIASDYQRTRIENVCMRLNLRCFAYLWRRDQEELLQEMIDAEVNAIVVKVAALGFRPELHLGASLKDMQPLLLNLHKKFGVNICGEGGEYETLTLDCPLYQRRIEVIQSEKVILSDDAFAPAGYLSIKNANLESKLWENDESVPTIQGRLEYIRNIVKNPMFYIQDCLDDISNKIFLETRLKTHSVPPEALPYTSNTEFPKSAISDYWKNKSMTSAQANRNAQSSHLVTFSPSSLLNIDTTVVQLNHSTGWCSLGNIAAPSVKEGFAFVRKHLERYDYDLRDIVAVNLCIRDMNEYAKVNKIYAQNLPSYCPPTRCCIAAPLPMDFGVIMTVVAHRLVSKTQKVVHATHHTVDKEVVHVQSISHWAPANIGPYSQCVRVGEIVYLSGQIPLIPGTLELLNTAIIHQCRLTLRHIFRVLLAANESYTMMNVMHGICYVSSEEIAREVTGQWSYVTKNEHAVIAIVVVSALPRGAQLEWQVLACGYMHPQVSYSNEIIADEFLLKCKRCMYAEHNTSSVVCYVSFGKKSSKKEKSMRMITSENIMVVMKHCLQFLRGDVTGSGTPLCTFSVFYKTTETTLASIIMETIKSSHDFKVVATCIPVLGFNESDAFLVITGVCH